MVSKKKLDNLAAKAGIGDEATRKLHQANGTADEGTTGGEAAPKEKRRSGGHGPSAPTMPNFGDI